MIRWPHILALFLLSGGTLMLGASQEPMAATSATPDLLSNDRAGDATDAVDIGAVKPIAPLNNRESAKPAPSGNPLWSVPLSALSATQERPIFSASRRPPQCAVVAPSVDQVAAPPPVVGPERPALALIGTVVGDGDAIAIFLDPTSQKIVRLRQGDTHGNWMLNSVQGREVTLKKADQVETLGIQRREGPSATVAGAGVPMPSSAAAPPGGFDTSYAPFVPRSPPKNGESDGL